MSVAVSGVEGQTSQDLTWSEAARTAPSFAVSTMGCSNLYNGLVRFPNALPGRALETLLAEIAAFAAGGPSNAAGHRNPKLGLLADWGPDEATRSRILVDNPAAPHRFD